MSSASFGLHGGPPSPVWQVYYFRAIHNHRIRTSTLSFLSKIIFTIIFTFSKWTTAPLNGATRKAGLDLARCVVIGKGQFSGG